MRNMGSKTQSLRDKRRSREGQSEKLRSRSTALQQTIKDVQKVVQEAQEELQGNAQNVVDIVEDMKDFQDEIICLEEHKRRTKS